MGMEEMEFLWGIAGEGGCWEDWGDGVKGNMEWIGGIEFD